MLDNYRKEIDEIDSQLVRLFERRMDAARRVGEYKREHGLPVLNAEREKQVIKSRTGQVENPAYREAAGEFFEDLMALSRRLQRGIVPETAEMAALAIENPRLVYPGVPGSYSEEAMRSFFGDAEQVENVTTFPEVIARLQNGEADYGVLPVENTSTGAVDDTLDLLAHSGLYIVGEVVLDINHCLLAVPGAQLSDIKEVYSHQQGLSQSSEFLNALSGVKLVPYYNTAIAAKYVAESGDKTKAAVASLRNAELYGLEILAENINRKHKNNTRFVILSQHRESEEGADKISIAFTLPHRSGTLYRLLSRFSEAELNLLHIESRPLPDKNFEYLFYIDFSGNLGDSKVAEALEKVRQDCTWVRVLGNYIGR